MPSHKVYVYSQLNWQYWPILAVVQYRRTLLLLLAQPSEAALPCEL